jgi:hypothetical protein
MTRVPLTWEFGRTIGWAEVDENGKVGRFEITDENAAAALDLRSGEFSLAEQLLLDIR